MADKTIREINKAFEDAKKLIGKTCPPDTVGKGTHAEFIIKSVILYFTCPSASLSTMEFFNKNQYVIELRGKNSYSVPYDMDDPPVINIRFPKVENQQGVWYIANLVAEPDIPKTYYWTFGCAKISHSIIQESYHILSQNTSKAWETESGWRIPTDIIIGNAQFNLTILQEMIDFYNSYTSKE